MPQILVERRQLSGARLRVPYERNRHYRAESPMLIWTIHTRRPPRYGHMRDTFFVWYSTKKEGETREGSFW